MFSLHHLLIISALFLVQSNCSDSGEKCNSIPKVKFEQVRALKDDTGVLLIDVRRPSELQEFGFIPGSINIPLAELENVLKNLSDTEFQQRFGRDKPALDFPLVFYCTVGQRSALAACTAVKLGYTNVRDYSGSWLDWEQQIKLQKLIDPVLA